MDDMTLINGHFRSNAGNGTIYDLEKYLKQGADINANHDGTALLYAARAGQGGNVAWLLEKGADVNATSNNGNTPLMEAALRDYTYIVGLLLDKWANLECKNKDGETALDYTKPFTKSRTLIADEPKRREEWVTSAAVPYLKRDITAPQKIRLKKSFIQP